MGQELVVFERQLQPLAPMFEQALADVMPVERLIRTAIISAERNPYLLECDRQSFFNTIMSAGVLGLEMDGVTGQCFPVPFAKRVQLIIGYKGYNTLGWRAKLTITGEAVREGDVFDYSLGTGAFVTHKPKLGNQGRIIAAWAQAAATGQPPVISILGIDELMAVKEKSPGAKKPDSPWNNPAIGFPAMCSKTAKRRLCRSTPLNVMQLAARMEEAHEEQGQHAYITAERAVVIESPIAGTQASEAPSAEDLTRPIDEDALKRELYIVAKGGMKGLEMQWRMLSGPETRSAASYKDDLKRIAKESDMAVGV